MGWLKRIFGKSDANPARDGQGWSIFGILGRDWVKQTGVWKDYTDAEREQAYGNLSLIFSCVRELATTAAEVPFLIVEDRDDDQIEPVEGHWLGKLLRRPNPYYSRSRLVEYYVMRLMLGGRSHVWKLRDSYHKLSELWPVPSSWVEVKTGKGRELVSHYMIKQSQGNKKRIEPEDMLYEFFPDPQSTWEGLGPMQACQRDYQMDLARGNLIVEMLGNLHVPGIKIKSPVPLTPGQKSDIRAALTDEIGEGKRGSPLLLGGEGVDAEILNPLKDLDMPGLATMTETRICSAFGVPPIIVGARAGLEHATYANYAEARKSMYKETAVPLWVSIGESFTRGFLIAEGEEGVRVYADIRGVAELQEDMNKAAERAKNLMIGSVAKRNEARQIAGLPALDTDDGEMLLVPATHIERMPGDLEEEEEEPVFVPDEDEEE